MGGVEEASKQVIATGVVGALLVLAIDAIAYLFRELRIETRARIDDAGKLNTIAMALQREVITVVNELVRIVEILEKRFDDSRERDRNDGSRR